MGKQDRAQKRAARQQLSLWSTRRVVAWSLFGVAVLVAVFHVLAHGGWRPIGLSMGWQDLLLGYPMAGLLAIVGLMTLDKQPPGR